MAQVPTSTKALVLGEKGVKDLGDGKEIPYYDAALEERELQKPREGDVVVKVATAGFNHREVRLQIISLVVHVGSFDNRVALDPKGPVSWN